MKKGLEPMLETTYDGEDLPHRLMWSIVEEHAELAKVQRNWGNPSLVAMVFAFHAMEAHLNYVGARLAPELWEKKREYFVSVRESADAWKGRRRYTSPSASPINPLRRLVALELVVAN